MAKHDQSNVLWPKLIVAGHSQGGGHAGIIGKHHEVARVLMFASADWWHGESRPADWMAANGATPRARYFALGHKRDLLVPKDKYSAGWIALGLDGFGEIQAPEAPSGIHFGGTHRLITDVEPRISTILLDAHSARIVDAYTPLMTDDQETPVMASAWRYMLAGPISPPTPEIEISASSVEVTIRSAAQPGFLYQLQISSDINTWLPVRDAVPGDEAQDHIEWKAAANGGLPSQFWRIEVRFE